MVPRRAVDRIKRNMVSPKVDNRGRRTPDRLWNPEPPFRPRNKEETKA
jgi:hypothetical protein